MSSIREEAVNLKIMSFKMCSGACVVALVNRNRRDESVVLVEDPLEVVTVPSADGMSYMVHFQEWMPLSASNLIAIQRHNIEGYCDANLDTKERYLETIISIAQKALNTIDESQKEEEYTIIEPEVKIVH